MKIREANPKTIKELEKIILEYADKETKSYNDFEDFKKRIMPMVGQPYTKKIETHLKKSYGPDYDIEMERIASLIYINVSKAGIEQGRYLIGYNTTPTLEIGQHNVNGSGLDCFCKSYGQASFERSKQTRAYLKKKAVLNKLAVAIENIREADKILSSKELGSYYFPPRYAIERFFKLERKEQR